jgi:hypothetical protein
MASVVRRRGTVVKLAHAVAGAPFSPKAGFLTSQSPRAFAFQTTPLKHVLFLNHWP